MHTQQSMFVYSELHDHVKKLYAQEFGIQQWYKLIDNGWSGLDNLRAAISQLTIRAKETK